MQKNESPLTMMPQYVKVLGQKIELASAAQEPLRVMFNVIGNLRCPDTHPEEKLAASAAPRGREWPRCIKTIGPQDRIRALHAYSPLKVSIYIYIYYVLSTLAKCKG